MEEEYKKHIKHPSFKSIIEYDFNFEEYMEKRLKDIKDIEERKFTDKYVKDVFSKIIESTEKKYEMLEQSVYDEFKLLDEKYGINITLTKKDDFSYTNDTLFPMCKEDLEENIVTLDDALNNNKYIKTVFFEGSEKNMQEFKNKVVEGKLYIENETYNCKFKILRAKRYFEKISNLYELFNYNYILWTTVNMAFVDRLYDIYLEEIEEDININLEKSIIKSVDVNFNKLKLDTFTNINENLIPIWNVEEINLNSAEFMKPFLDEKYYEHNIELKEYGLENGYLLGINDDIYSLKLEEDKIIVKSTVETFENWIAYKIVNKEPIKSIGYDYDMLNNKKKENFTRRYLTNNRITLKTEFDYIRRINELSIEKYIEYAGYEILSSEYISKFEIYENDMNLFEKENVFAYDDRKILLFKFKVLDKNCYFTDSIIRFVISQIQLEENDYKCIGVTEDYKVPKIIKEEIY
ncbi:hypothetical protein [uncultured Tyzzerella sp.]|uniref:hypothetical protein n=1 Tax=uncultured Tyzzerella sp. TaxID=2321398 RepID=UPI002942A3D0|nr:hypothetical protein [uncultured Tyzzerella sp.]